MNMTTIFCDACSMNLDKNSAKCENCESTTINELESDFNYIEEAELNGEIYNVGTINGVLVKDEVCESIQITQYIKEEPEIQIEPDTLFEDEHIKPGISEQPERTSLYNNQCSECNKRFKRKAALRYHFKTVHCESDVDSEFPNISQPKPKIKILKCKFCGKLTKDNEEHLKHLKLHENLRKKLPSGLKKCEVCRESFLNNFELKIHRAQHTDSKIFQCDICNAFLSTEKVLENHKIKLHSGKIDSSAPEKCKFVCEFCSERFPVQILLTRHKQTHTEYNKLIQDSTRIHKVGNRLTYICKTCGKQSSDKSRHTAHMRVHTKEKPFPCDLCESSFSSLSSLRCHVRLHSDERPFKCNICDVTYRHKRSLVKHLLRHTGKKFKCDYCKRSFSDKNTKADHERQKHTGETPYQCEVCESWFTTVALRFAHKQQEHGINKQIKNKVNILIKKIDSTDCMSSSE